jgi:hypothetical protein
MPRFVPRVTRRVTAIVGLRAEQTHGLIAGFPADANPTYYNSTPSLRSSE